jgi:hypothetical protein
MPVKFIAIYQDPWVNDTNEFVLILAWVNAAIPVATTGQNSVVSIALVDPQGNVMSRDLFAQNTVEATNATAYPYAFSATYNKLAKQVILIPPGWLIRNFGSAIGLQGTLEELKGYF